MLHCVVQAIAEVFEHGTNKRQRFLLEMILGTESTSSK